MASNSYSRARTYSPQHDHPPYQSPNPRAPPRRSILHSDLYTPPPPRPSAPIQPFPKIPIETFTYDYVPPTPPRLHFLSNWWLSLLSLALSITALGAITLLLLVVNNKPLPSLPLNITVNTYVSFFSTLAKGCMLVSVSESISQLKWLWFRKPRRLQDIQVFDEASRGPLGAATMVFRTGWGNLAVLGAVVMLGALVMEPFAQLIVRYPVRSVEAGIATVGRAQAYDSGRVLETLETGLLVGPEWGMKAAIYDGIFKPKGVEDLAPSCSSGNCTFPLFDSLAICSKCLNVTELVINTNPQRNPSTLRGRQTISYTIPGGGFVDFNATFEEGSVAIGPSIVATTVLPDSLPKQVFNISNPLLALAVLQFPHVQKLVQSGNYYSSLPVTYECVLYFCVNTYNVTVVNNVPNTTLVSSWTSENGTPTVGGALQVGGMKGTLDAILDQPDSGKAYRVAAGTLANLKAWLNVTLQGTMNTTFSKVDSPTWANDDIQALNGTSDWTFLMGSLAKAMTTFIRSPGNPNATEHVEGGAYRQETYVHVQWAWMALPGLLVAASIVFLLATMFKNESNGALPWKSSSLALLFHGLDGMGGGWAGLDERVQMQELARNTRVVLNRAPTGEWKLMNLG